MADWGQRPKDRDRDDAIKQIEAAAARGQIVEADKVKRIQEVKAAGTVGEIGLITRGLALPAAPGTINPAPTPPPVSTPAPPVTTTFEQYSPGSAPPVSEPDLSAGPPPSVTYGEPLTPSAGTPISTPPMIKKSGGAGKLVLLFVLIMLAGIAVPIFIGIKALVDNADDVLDGITPGSPNVFSADAIEDLKKDVEDEIGSTKVFQVSFYPEYAVVAAPADGNRKRHIIYYWDGDLSESTKGSGIYEGIIDMKDIDPDVVIKMVGEARKLVEDPTSSYVVASAPGSDGGALSAYASNDFSESGHLTATFDGEILTKAGPS